MLPPEHTATMTGETAQTAIDLSHLSRQCGGDVQLEHELLALFAEQCTTQLAIITAATGTTGRDAAHTLKGAALAIGAWQVADAAHHMEASLTGIRMADGLDELEAAADAARLMISHILAAA